MSVLVSVVIVSYNCKTVLLNCLKSIYSFTKKVTFEIIVVDNASADNTVDEIRRNFKNVILIEEKENLGFGKANNVGAKLAKGEFLFFLNPDTLLVNDAISILVDYTMKHSFVGLCGGRLLTQEGKENASYSSNFPNLKRELYLSLCIAEKLNELDITSSKNVAWVCGADMLLPKSVFFEIGGFDETFFMYYEEPDICKRINKLGLNTYFVPEAQIIHLEGKSSAKNTIVFFISIDSQLRYLKKWNYFLYLIIFFVRLCKGMLAFFVYFVLNNKSKKKYWAKYLQVLFDTINSNSANRFELLQY